MVRGLTGGSGPFPGPDLMRHYALSGGLVLWSRATNFSPWRRRSHAATNTRASAAEQALITYSVWYGPQSRVST